MPPTQMPALQSSLGPHRHPPTPRCSSLSSPWPVTVPTVNLGACKLLKTQSWYLHVSCQARLDPHPLLALSTLQPSHQASWFTSSWGRDGSPDSQPQYRLTQSTCTSDIWEISGPGVGTSSCLPLTLTFKRTVSLLRWTWREGVDFQHWEGIRS